MYTFYFQFKDNSEVKITDVVQLKAESVTLEEKDFERSEFPDPSRTRTIRLMTKDGQAVVMAHEIKYYHAYK